jgi:hypothetical protein
MLWDALIQLALPLMFLLLLPVLSFAVCASCVSCFEHNKAKCDMFLKWLVVKQKVFNRPMVTEPNYELMSEKILKIWPENLASHYKTIT